MLARKQWSRPQSPLLGAAFGDVLPHPPVGHREPVGTEVQLLIQLEDRAAFLGCLGLVFFQQRIEELTGLVQVLLVGREKMGQGQHGRDRFLDRLAGNGVPGGQGARQPVAGAVVTADRFEEFCS
ncbi:hypothetical protein [Streptomyces sp. NPDC127114]|uniref:hypothetical protein n=1 Tax=Streptomyces sp. NPDC127114 TaxID=3345366 RepID=UPI00363C6346